VATLEAFDRLEQFQELRGWRASGPAQDQADPSVLDVGCGFGIEPLRLARLVQPDGNDAEALVGVGGFLGIGERSVAIPLDQIQMQGDRLTTSVTRESLGAMQPYDEGGYQERTAPARSGAGCRTDPR
jgi:hypothetical protein